MYHDQIRSNTPEGASVVCCLVLVPVPIATRLDISRVPMPLGLRFQDSSYSRLAAGAECDRDLMRSQGASKTYRDGTNTGMSKEREHGSQISEREKLCSSGVLQFIWPAPKLASKTAWAGKEVAAGIYLICPEQKEQEPRSPPSTEIRFNLTIFSLLRGRFYPLFSFLSLLVSVSAILV